MKYGNYQREVCYFDSFPVKVMEVNDFLDVGHFFLVLYHGNPTPFLLLFSCLSSTPT